MTEPIRPQVHCPHEECRHAWERLPAAVALAGYQPLEHRCRRCGRWWWIVYHVSLGFRLRWRLVRIVPSLGRQPAKIREALKAAPELDVDAIECAVALHTLWPEVGP